MLATPPLSPPRRPLPEQRVVFRNLSWESYQQILQALGNKRSSRLSYDEGTLEITMPFEEHEWTTRLFDLFIRVLIEEMELRLKTMGSTTLDRQELRKGAEPDCSFYIQNYLKVRNKTVNLKQDPPPDLVVEVDITHTDINKFNLYAGLGIPEFWRYNGKVLKIYHLQDGRYAETQESPTFALALQERLSEFLQDCREDEVAASRRLRAWVRSRRSGRTHPPAPSKEGGNNKFDVT
ncbi:MAG: Uma2 family endonuclease [Cyanobacteria bacterium RI_101]|nr:Uma2 family endonuclease [Cyanobacteria bacterium RI_101]